MDPQLQPHSPLHDNKGLSLWGSIFVGVAAFVVPQILVGIAFSIWATVTQKDIDALLNSNSVELNFVFSLSVAIVGLAIIALAVKRAGGFKSLGFITVPAKKLFTFIPAYLVYFTLLIIAFTAIDYFKLGVDLDQDQVVGFEDASRSLQLIFAFISLVILAPIFEEILFRGLLFQGIARKTGFWPASILVSGLFGLAHMQLNVGIDTFLMGMTASWLVWQTKSIYPAILLHMLKNSVAYIMLFVVS